jgi:vacuolar-type H+-ATPase subunit H
LEKLERVLSSEEDARRRLAEARETAASLRADAVVQARGIVDDAAAAAAAQAAEAREAVLRSAESEAGALLADAERAREEAVSTARGRLDAAAAVLAARLKG